MDPLEYERLQSTLDEIASLIRAGDQGDLAMALEKVGEAKTWLSVSRYTATD